MTTLTTTHRYADRVATVHRIEHDVENASLVLSVSVTTTDLPAVPYRVEVPFTFPTDWANQHAHTAEPMLDAWRRSRKPWQDMTTDEQDRDVMLSELERAAELAATTTAAELASRCMAAAWMSWGDELRRRTA